MRTETVINNTYDFGVKHRLHNLGDLKEVGFTANRRLPPPGPGRAIPRLRRNRLQGAGCRRKPARCRSVAEAEHVPWRRAMRDSETGQAWRSGKTAAARSRRARSGGMESTSSPVKT